MVIARDLGGNGGGEAAPPESVIVITCDEASTSVFGRSVFLIELLECVPIVPTNPGNISDKSC